MSTAGDDSDTVHLHLYRGFSVWSGPVNAADPACGFIGRWYDIITEHQEETQGVYLQSSVAVQIAHDTIDQICDREIEDVCRQWGEAVQPKEGDQPQ